MERIIKYLKTVSPFVIVIAILVLLLILCKECQRCKPCPDVETETIIVYKTDTVWKEIVITQIDTVFKYVFIDKPIPPDADCDEVKQDYFGCRYYEETLIDNDTLAYLQINDSVCRNRLVYRDWTYINKVPKIVETVEIITTKTIIEPCNRFNLGIGGTLGGNTDRFNAGASIMLQTNKKSSYTVSYDFINKEANIGIYWMLK